MYVLKLRMKMVSLKCQYISKLHTCHIPEDYLYL